MSLDLSNNDYAKKLMGTGKTPEADRVSHKVYFHHHNHARFHFDMGGSRVKTVEFAAHKYITDSKREQDQLDLVADMPGTFIYTLPNSEHAMALVKELEQENQKSVMKTAQAAAAVANQTFDASIPIVAVTNNTPAGLQALTAQVVPGVVGMQNSFSGTAATEGNAPVATVVQPAPPSAADAALAQLRTMEQKLK